MTDIGVWTPNPPFPNLPSPSSVSVQVRPTRVCGSPRLTQIPPAFSYNYQS